MTGLKITAQTVAIPLDRVTHIATRNVSERQYVIVTVEDEAGATGYGYCYAGTIAGTQVERFITDVLAPVLQRQGSVHPVQAWKHLYQETLLVGRRGLSVRALSALDIALWDYLARSADMPLAALLGGDPSVPVPAYASGGYYVDNGMTPEEYVREEIARNIDVGFVDHKIKVGGLSVAEDAARVAAAVDTIAGRGRLGLDANNAYRNVPEALAAITEFESAAGGPLWWFEEPLSPDDIRGHAALSERHTGTPIATGEIHQTRWDFHQLITERACLYLQPDVGVLGGVTEYLRVMHAAESAGIFVAPHWHANIHAHLAAASTNTVAVEYFDLEKDIYNFEKLLVPDQRLRFAEGVVHLPDGPGLGFEFDAEALDRYRIGG